MHLRLGLSLRPILIGTIFSSMSLHSALAMGFWLSAGVVVYTYLLYPALLALWAGRCAGQQASYSSERSYQSTFSLVLCAHNEAGRILGRLKELLQMVGASRRIGEIIVVSDGSSDDTAAIARSAAGDGIHVLEIPSQLGKARALTLGALEARGEVLVFADARQRWATDAIDRLLDNFSKPGVGAVSGELVLESSPGSLAGVGLYWRYEKWIRRNEGIVNSTVGVSGAIAAVRRALFRPIPQGIVLDDLYWPMQVVLAGSRVIHDPSAIAYDTLPPRPKDEFRRKIRTLSGNYQFMAALPAVLSPIDNPVWIQFLSHKVLRLVVPWLLIVMMATSAALSDPMYRGLVLAQAIGYGVAILALSGVPGSKSRFGAAAASFLLLNIAAWVGFWVWIVGRSGRSWNKTRYQADESSGQCVRPMRIAFVIDTFMIGGTELNAIRTLEALDRSRFEVTVFHLNEQGPLRARYEALGVRMVYSPISGFRSLKTLRQGVRLGLSLRRMRIQVLHCHDVYSNIFAAPWARILGNCRVIASRRWFYDVPRAALNPLNRWSYRFAHRVLANSGSVVQMLAYEEGVAREKIVEIPNFLNESAFQLVTPSRRLEQRRKWDIPDGAFVVGVVARLATIKNHAMLLRSVQSLDGDTHVVLVGDGPERQSLQSLAQELGVAARVHFVGAIISPVNLHQYFDVSVLCSRSEGFPNSVIEALAACRPVVATRVGGVGDVVKDNITGLLVESGNTSALTQALGKVRSNAELRARLGEFGQRRVRAEYSQQVVVSKLQDLYVQLAEHGEQ